VRVIVPYAAATYVPGLRPETVEALERYCPYDVEYVDVSDDVTSYHRLIVDEWWPRVDLVVVEHDVVVHETVFQTFEQCPEPWCVFPYPRGGECLVGLGCARFRKELPEIRPSICGRHWMSVDTWVAGMLQMKGFAPHPHEPWVGHVKSGRLLLSTG
jgi:hypothetical protein